MGKWEKLIQEILLRNQDLRFEDLTKALIKMDYSQHQPSGGSSHYTFRKEGCMLITLPKHNPMNKAYINLVREAVLKYLSEED